MTKPKPPTRTQHEQEFLDMAAIQLMAAQIGAQAVPTDRLPRSCELIFDAAEALLTERNKRLQPKEPT